MNTLSLEKSTLSERVTKLLRQHILSGAWPAGAQLKQEELAARFDISLGSLREALRTLQADGLVTIAPNRGAQVSDLSADEAGEIFDIRAFLELGALGLAWPRLTEPDLAEAESLIRRMDEAEDTARWSGLNREFHETLYRPAGRPKLLGLIANLHDNVGRYLRLYLDTMNFQAESQSEHRALVEAGRRNDLPAAENILRNHLSHARRQLVQYLLRRDTQ